MRITACPSRPALHHGALLVTICCLVASQASAQQAMWRAKGPATTFSADWSRADQTDAAATKVFLEQIWPGLKKVSSALDARLKARAGLYSGPRSDRETAAGAVCFPLRVEQAVASSSVPTAKQVTGRKFDIYAARGQSEAVCIGVHATRDVREVTVTCGDLVGPSTIAASAVTVRLSLAWTFEPRGRGKYANRQMVLLNVPSWDIPAGTSRLWVVDVHVPADAKAGKYAGKITVTVTGKTAAVFDLSLDVLPVTLSDNGCRWGSFMTPNPAKTTDAWCGLNARYGVNTLAWWNLDVPQLNWTWDGCQRDETVLAKPRNADGSIASARMKTMPPWIKSRWDGTFITFKLDEVVGLPPGRDARGPFYKKPMKLRADLGELTDEQAAIICYDRPGMASNFEPESIDSVTFQRDEALAEFDAGMKRLKKHGFAGPITWFGSGGPTGSWETRVVAQRFGRKYSRADWAWRPEVTSENSNHAWYLANAAIAKSLSDARRDRGWPEIVWCPVDESFQYKGVSGRAAACMVGEMMPYVRKYAPEARIYMVVWHTRKDNWKGMWQCGALQSIKTTAAGKPSATYGPYQVICTNCPNDLDRKTTVEAGGEYWIYTFYTSTVGSFAGNRFSFGFNGARHDAAVVFNFADSDSPANIPEGGDVGKSIWITGQYTTNYYMSAETGSGKIDHALASHAALAARGGIYDRKYLETLRRMAHAAGSAEDIAFVKNIGAMIDRIGGAGKGGIDDFTADITDEQGPGRLRRLIAERIKALVAKSHGKRT